MSAEIRFAEGEHEIRIVGERAEVYWSVNGRMLSTVWLPVPADWLDSPASESITTLVFKAWEQAHPGNLELRQRLTGKLP